ncbi:VanZ family protein [Massilia sp. RP-1-19]|uniref:VanZ family protein n=1 Tax=Massilia polaris TaxID=2728846 RepID=A0A848HNZ4_9BURK|nr:VanZ family protein [Massilia polaris]NML62894.1 VanZ family protein [Massilia polaris]
MPALLSRLVLDPGFQRLRYRSAFIMYAAIVAMGAIPGVRAEIGNFASGIVLHTLAYGAITFLLYTGTSGTGRARALKSVLTVAAMGAVDELVQSFLPYRRGALSDWLVDCNAAIVVAGLLWAFLPGQPRHAGPGR